MPGREVITLLRCRFENGSLHDPLCDDEQVNGRRVDEGDAAPHLPGTRDGIPCGLLRVFERNQTDQVESIRSREDTEIQLGAELIKAMTHAGVLGPNSEIGATD